MKQREIVELSPRGKPRIEGVLPWLAALAILLAAWILPLPGLVLSEDQYAAEHTPQIRIEAEAARSEFLKAQEHYTAYIKSHDLGASRTVAENALLEASADSGNPQKLIVVRDTLVAVRQYADELHDYAAAGDNYFAKLTAYDGNLMAWTRSLGSSLERLRNETWPFVEYLKRYPLPAGEKTDPPMINAAQVLSQTAMLDQHIAALNPNPDPHTVDTSREKVIEAVHADIAGIWSNGRSVENLGSLHAEYHTLLQSYDTKVQAAAASTQTSAQPTGRFYLAVALNLLVAALVLAGIGGLLMPKGGLAVRRSGRSTSS